MGSERSEQRERKAGPGWDDSNAFILHATADKARSLPDRDHKSWAGDAVPTAYTIPDDKHTIIHTAQHFPSLLSPPTQLSSFSFFSLCGPSMATSPFSVLSLAFFFPSISLCLCYSMPVCSTSSFGIPLFSFFFSLEIGICTSFIYFWQISRALGN